MLPFANIQLAELLEKAICAPVRSLMRRVCLREAGHQLADEAKGVVNRHIGRFRGTRAVIDSNTSTSDIEKGL